MFLNLSSVKASAATVLLGDGADGSITFNMLEQSGTHLNRGGAITKDGYLSIDLTNQTQYGGGGGVVSVMSSSKIDVSDVYRLSLNCSIVSLPSDVSFSDLYFNFGLTSTNVGFPLNYIADTGNSAFPTLDFGLSEIKGVSFPVEFNVSDVVGEYYLTFGFSCPYVSSNPRCVLKFYDLVLYNNDGSSTVIDDLIFTFNQTIDNVNDQIAENFGALGFAHDTVENFISLFNEDPPDPVITVPPLKMKIQGVEHQFFNGYQYDFRDMETGGLSVLVGAARTAGTLVLWWAFFTVLP